ncbi:hypothetical protein M769_0106985 [Bacillus haynesii]|nr:hypothetical protein M769_0106985 [Bacillus haynesii]
MSENKKAKQERKIGMEGFVLLLSLIFISIFIATAYEIPSNLLLIILFFIGSGYYSIRLVSKGLLRKKKGLGFKAAFSAFVVWMALSFLFHDISYPFSLKGLEFQIMMFLLFYIPFYFIFQFAFKFSSIQERKQLKKSWKFQLFLLILLFALHQHLRNQINLFADRDRIVRVERVKVVDKDTVVFDGIKVFPNGRLLQLVQRFAVAVRVIVCHEHVVGCIFRYDFQGKFFDVAFFEDVFLNLFRRF